MTNTNTADTIFLIDLKDNIKQGTETVSILSEGIQKVNQGITAYQTLMNLYSNFSKEALYDTIKTEFLKTDLAKELQTKYQQVWTDINAGFDQYESLKTIFEKVTDEDLKRQFEEEIQTQTIHFIRFNHLIPDFPTNQLNPTQQQIINDIIAGRDLVETLEEHLTGDIKTQAKEKIKENIVDLIDVSLKNEGMEFILDATKELIEGEGKNIEEVLTKVENELVKYSASQLIAEIAEANGILNVNPTIIYAAIKDFDFAEFDYKNFAEESAKAVTKTMFTDMLVSGFTALGKQLMTQTPSPQLNLVITLCSTFISDKAIDSLTNFITNKKSLTESLAEVHKELAGKNIIQNVLHLDDELEKNISGQFLDNLSKIQKIDGIDVNNLSEGFLKKIASVSRESLKHINPEILKEIAELDQSAQISLINADVIQILEKVGSGRDLVEEEWNFLRNNPALNGLKQAIEEAQPPEAFNGTYIPPNSTEASIYEQQITIEREALESNVWNQSPENFEFAVNSLKTFDSALLIDWGTIQDQVAQITQVYRDELAKVDLSPDDFQRISDLLGSMESMVASVQFAPDIFATASTNSSYVPTKDDLQIHLENLSLFQNLWGELENTLKNVNLFSLDQSEDKIYPNVQSGNLSVLEEAKESVSYIQELNGLLDQAWESAIIRVQNILAPYQKQTQLWDTSASNQGFSQQALSTLSTIESLMKSPQDFQANILEIENQLQQLNENIPSYVNPTDTLLNKFWKNTVSAQQVRSEFQTLDHLMESNPTTSAIENQITKVITALESAKNQANNLDPNKVGRYVKAEVLMNLEEARLLLSEIDSSESYLKLKTHVSTLIGESGFHSYEGTTQTEIHQITGWDSMLDVMFAGNHHIDPVITRDFTSPDENGEAYGSVNIEYDEEVMGDTPLYIPFKGKILHIGKDSIWVAAPDGTVHHLENFGHINRHYADF
ncbi:hypothetical protein WDW89_17285 [Deltaproteobacteria bacterium TL4]